MVTLRLFGKRPIPLSDDERQSAGVDLERIQRGGIPLGAERRLKAIAAADSPVFTSDLSQEMGVLTQAMYAAREPAMTRMEEEAEQLSADGIVGVRLDVGRYEWGADMAEFIAVGTAIKHKGGKVHRAPNGRPFTSDLSGQAFWTLMQTGKRPVGLVMGNCVYHVAHRGMMQSMRQTSEHRAGAVHPGPVRRSRTRYGTHAEGGRGDR